MAGREPNVAVQARNEARRKRQPVQQVKQEPAMPIFNPVKSNTKDDLCLSVQETLGSFGQIKPHEFRNLVGRQPQTPVGTKQAIQFPTANGQVKNQREGAVPASSTSSSSSSSSSWPSRSQHPGNSASSGARPSSHTKGGPDATSVQKRVQAKQPAAGASSSQGVKRESGGTSASSSSQSSSSSSSASSSQPHKQYRSSSHDKAKESATRRPKDSSSASRTKSRTSGTPDTNNSQSRTVSQVTNPSSSKQERQPSSSLSSSANSKSGSSHPATNPANRGSSSNSSSACDSKTVLHANGLLTETESSHSVTGYTSKTSNLKTDSTDKKHQSLDNKNEQESRQDFTSKDSDSNFIPPAPDPFSDISLHSFNREVKKEKDRDGDNKPRPKLNINKANHPGHSRHKEVEKILEKMTGFKTPVSAIQTPVKVDATKFPFTDTSQSHGGNGGQPAIPRKVIKKLDEAIDEDSEKNGDNEQDNEESSLKNDLLLTDDESEDEEAQDVNNGTLNSSNEACEEATSSIIERPSSPMKRATDSESSSDTEGENTSGSESESESESDVEPTPPKVEAPAPKKSYSLVSTINKLRRMMPPVPANTPSTPSLHREPFSSKSQTSFENPSSFGLEIGDASKRLDHSVDLGDNDNEENDSFSKYNNDSNGFSVTDFHQLNEINTLGKPSPSGGRTGSSKKAPAKSSTSGKPTVKRVPQRTDNSGGSKSSSSSKGSSTNRVKSESSSKEKTKETKTKTSKQSSKSASSQNRKSPGPGSSKTTKSQEKKPPQRAKPYEKLKKPPKSSAFVDTDGSDSDNDERTNSRPLTAAVNTSTSSSSSSSSGSLSTSNIDTSDSISQSQVKPDSGKRMPGTKKSDKFIPKSEPLEMFEHQRHGIDEFLRMEPILSPMRHDEEDYIRLATRRPLMDIKYDKEGIPSLFVRLDRSLIDHLPPKSDPFKCELSVASTSTQRKKDSTDQPEKPSAIVKPVKRKPTELEKEKSASRRPEAKRSRLENKSPRRMREESLRVEPNEPMEPFVSSETSALDRRRSTERRGSVSSVASQQSSQGNRGRKTDRDHHHQPGRPSKRDPPDPTGQRIHDWTSPERRTDRQLSADEYLNEGKKLKHLADSLVDKSEKALTYFDAVLYLTSCGNAIELDPHVPDEKAVTMYSDTCEIIRFILKLKGIHSGQEGNSNDNKLAVLCYRSQALLYMHMFKLKRQAAMKLSQALTEHFKGTTSKPQPPMQQTPSPWSSSARYTGTPSPMSPTPSPAGSVGSACSMGSQGSNSSDMGPTPTTATSALSTSKLCNGLGAMSTPQSTVAMPQRIVSIMSTFLTYSNYSLYSIDFWEQAETLAQENLNFFLDLDRECGELTLHSSTEELVRYVRYGLTKLRDLR